jgi:hypothetical protein
MPSPEGKGPRGELKPDSSIAPSPITWHELVGLARQGPGIFAQVIGGVLVFIAAGFRFDWFGGSLSGSQFTAVFLGGLALILVGAVITLTRQRMSADAKLQDRKFQFEARMQEARQEHEFRLARANAAEQSGANATGRFNESYKA